MKFFGILLLVPFLLVSCNKFSMKLPMDDGKIITAEASSAGRGAVRITVDPVTKKIEGIGCYDATSDWLALRILPSMFQGIIAAYRGMAPQALGGGPTIPGPSPISGCDALFQGTGEDG